MTLRCPGQLPHIELQILVSGDSNISKGSRGIKILERKNKFDPANRSIVQQL